MCVCVRERECVRGRERVCVVCGEVCVCVVCVWWCVCGVCVIERESVCGV